LPKAKYRRNYPYSAKQKDRFWRPFDFGRADCVLRRLFFSVFG
jgi:hypothetical protein